jgi:membrane protein involved in D-alanine export
VIPYTDLLYFAILIGLTLCAVALAVAGRLSWRSVVALNAAMLVIQYAGRTNAGMLEIWVVAVYGVYEWCLASLFLRLRRARNSRPTFLTCVTLALLPLIGVRLAALRGGTGYLAFTGISYVTFRSVDVIICIQDKLIASIAPAGYFTFLLFFPTVSAGPIDRYMRFAKDASRPRTRAEFFRDLDAAVQLVFRGLLYKFILAAVVKQYWMDRVSEGAQVTTVASYMYAYTFYLFFDFAGYSAFAVGVGYLLGIHTPPNFDRPFLAGNIAEFWNRWHISLSTWFRDHVYMRFVMAAVRGRWFASRLAISCAALYVTFMLMGIWHGLSLRYVTYGLYHGTLLSGHAIFVERRKDRQTSPPTPLWKIASVIITFHCVALGFLIFSGRLG